MCLPETSSSQPSHKSGFKVPKSLTFITSAPLQTLLKQDIQTVSRLQISHSSLTPSSCSFYSQSWGSRLWISSLWATGRGKQGPAWVTWSGDTFIMWLTTCIFPCRPLWQLINTSTKTLQGSNRGYSCQEERPWGSCWGSACYLLKKSQYMLWFQLQTQTYCRDNRAVTLMPGFTYFWTNELSWLIC